MPIASLSRRDPQKTGNGFSNKLGFTVIELMVAVAVIAIITSLAFPSYRAMIEKRQVTSGAEQVAAFLSAVQIESVMRNENMTVSYHHNSGDAADWCVGLTAGATPCDCTETDASASDYCAVDAVPRLLVASDLTYPGVMDSITGNDSFTFDPVRGVLLDPSDVVEMELLSTGGNFALNVEVGPTGRVRICSDSSNKKVPGYDLC